MPNTTPKSQRAKQRSITSFFSSAARTPLPAPPPPLPRPSSSKKNNPASARKPPTSASKKTPVSQSSSQPTVAPSSQVKRTLFADNEADPVDEQRSFVRKRRRLIRLDEDEDEDEDDENDTAIDVDFADDETTKPTTTPTKQQQHPPATKQQQYPALTKQADTEDEEDETETQSQSLQNTPVKTHDDTQQRPTSNNPFGSSFRQRFAASASKQSTPLSSSARKDSTARATTATTKSPFRPAASRDDDNEKKKADHGSDGGSTCATSGIHLVRQMSHSRGIVSSSDTAPSACSSVALPAEMTKSLAKARRALVDLSCVSNVAGQDNSSSSEGWCAKHTWTTNIRDSHKRTPDDPLYDKSTLYVPPGTLAPASKVLTPFQKQFWNIKATHYDVVIFFKKGKFYEMYDIDADVAHSILGLNFTRGGRVDMRCCGVPEQAYAKHASKLIELSYKVGRVEQTETANAAEKRKQSNASSSAVCERTLVRIETRATVLDESLIHGHQARYIVSIIDDVTTTTRPLQQRSIEAMATASSDATTIAGDDEDDDNENEVRPVTIGICFVDVAAGGITIRQFQDDEQLGLTERLITFLAPYEIVYDSSACTQRLSNIVKWSARKFHSDLTDTKLLEKARFKPVPHSELSTYLSHKNQSESHHAALRRLHAYTTSYSIGSHALGAMVTQLQSLRIDKEVLSLGSYSLFPEPDITSTGSHNKGTSNENSQQQQQQQQYESNVGTTNNMKHTVKQQQPDNLILSIGEAGGHDRLYMDASALQNLEVLTSTLGTDKGSLLKFVDRCSTPAGRRLLRKWMAEPLASASAINERLDAVEDLHVIQDMDGGRILERICKLLRSKKDLERSLPKLHQFAIIADGAVMFDDTNQRKVKDFIHILRAIEDNLKACELLCEAMEQNAGVMKSTQLKSLCTSPHGVPSEALDTLTYFLGDAFDIERAENDGKIIPNKGAVPSFDASQEALRTIEADLNTELVRWKRQLRDDKIKFHHRGKEPYQIEISRDTIGRSSFHLPPEFDVTSESKTAQRFYTARVRQLVKRHVSAAEAFEAESCSVARKVVTQFDKHYSMWSHICNTAAHLDVLIGLSKTSRLGDGHTLTMSRPTILPDSHPHPVFRARALRHPILIDQCGGNFIPNDVALGHGADADIMILTGPNAGGKSTLSRQVALSVVLAQVGCFVPADSLTLRPFRDVFVRMGASDDIARGRSTFMVEMEEVSRMLAAASARSLIIADEVGRGTSTHDGFAIATQVLRHFAAHNAALTIFSTHYSKLADTRHIFPAGTPADARRCAVFEMDAAVDTRRKTITFLYKLKKGASGLSRGNYCARVAGIDANVADEAERAAAALDRHINARLTCNAVTRLAHCFHECEGDDDLLEHRLADYLKTQCVVRGENDAVAT